MYTPSPAVGVHLSRWAANRGPLPLYMQRSELHVRCFLEKPRRTDDICCGWAAPFAINLQTSDEMTRPHPFFPLTFYPVPQPLPSRRRCSEKCGRSGLSRATHSCFYLCPVAVQVEVPDHLGLLGSRLTYYMHACSQQDSRNGAGALPKCAKELGCSR